MSSLSTPCRISEKIEKSNGYGYIYYQGKKRRAHRVAYCEHNGVTLASIAGILVRHTCDNRPCVNGEHLLLGSYQDNSDDKLSRNRQAKGESAGASVLTEAQVKYIREVYQWHSRTHGAEALGRALGVSATSVMYAIKRKTWRHID